MPDTTTETATACATEWGVQHFPGSDVTPMPEDRARRHVARRVEHGDTGVRLVSRQVSPWTAVDPTSPPPTARYAVRHTGNGHVSYRGTRDECEEFIAERCTAMLEVVELDAAGQWQPAPQPRPETPADADDDEPTAHEQVQTWNATRWAGHPVTYWGESEPTNRPGLTGVTVGIAQVVDGAATVQVRDAVTGARFWLPLDHVQAR